MATPKRTGRAPKVEAVDTPSALVVKGLDANDIAALEAELAARRSSLPAGATISRNGLVVALVREALGAARKARSSAP